MSDFKNMSDKELKERYLGLYQLIYEIGCFGVSDLMSFYAIENELVKRGYEITAKPTIRKMKV